MFTGIIEAMGKIVAIRKEGTNLHFDIDSSLSGELSIDQSVSHSGVCLTVVALSEHQHTVTAIAETLEKTALGQWKTGDLLNLERCLPINGRLDGHYVQGHVDGTGTCIGREEKDGSWEFRIQFDRSFTGLVIEKGSISLNGTSLTIFDVSENQFTVAIIPYTYEHTNISHLQEGDAVNLEFDLIGKYILRNLGLKKQGFSQH